MDTQAVASKPIPAPPAAKKPSYKTINDANSILFKDKYNYIYPETEKIDVNSGVFIPLESNQTIKDLMEDVYKEVHALNQYWSIPVYADDYGEQILDQVVIQSFKHLDNNRGWALDSNGKRVVEGTPAQIPRGFQVRQYVARAVTKDDNKISADGALIVRVF